MAAVRRYPPQMIESWVRSGHWTPQATVDFWLRNAQTRPHAVALGDGREQYTWFEAAQAIQRLAGGLVDSGVSRDAVLLVQAPNSALLVLFRLACELAGIIPAFLHVGFRRAEIEAVAAKVGAAGAVVAPSEKFDALPLCRALAGLRHLFTVEPYDAAVPCLASLPAAGGSSTFEARRIRPFEMTGVVTSSGTTGLPKCIEYSCWPRLASGRVYIDRLRMSERDVVMTCIPFYTGGGDMQFHATPQCAARLLVMPRFSAEATCAAITRHGVTGAVMVPTMIARIAGLTDLADYDLSSLRWVVSGGGMLAYDVGARFEAMTGAKIVQGYGLMDYGALASHGVDDEAETRLRSIGRLLPGTELRVVGEDGSELPPGSTGELCARGPHCNGGYISDEEAMRAAWRGGFFRTGDLGRVSADGLVTLEGRSKDIVIRGGQNISAPEVEMLVCRHPAVADAALVRIADPELGERACACVVLRPGARLTLEDLAVFLKAQEIAAYKIPERLEVVAEFPMTAADNKVDKRALEARIGASPPP